MSKMKKQRQTSAARQAASRANSMKSTGPKTQRGKMVSSRNSLKHGQWAEPGARPLWQSMAALGEDPSRYQALLSDVVNSWSPRNGLEHRLCQDVTRLLLLSERNQRAQEAKVVRTMERLESLRNRQRREMEQHSSYNALQSEVLEKGLRRAPDSPAKFSETSACLDRLRTRVESGDCSDETELDALYGSNPTFRGAGIINGFRDLAKNPNDHKLRSGLRVMILEEMRDVEEECALYFQEHVEISRAMRLECLAPTDVESRQLQRQASNLDRWIDRKVKLLLMLRRAAQRDDAEQDGCGAAAAPIGWLDAEARQTLLPPGWSPQKQAGSGELALRHKMDKPNKAVSNDRWENVIKSINEIYGLSAQPADEKAAPPMNGNGGSNQPLSPSGGEEVGREEKSTPFDAGAAEEKLRNAVGLPEREPSNGVEPGLSAED